MFQISLIRKKVLFPLVLISMGAVSGYYFHQVFLHSLCESRYEFVNSDLLCSAREELLSKVQYTDLRVRLEEYIESERRAGKLKDVGIYFRDLHQGPVMGINETLDFAPASLLKLPLAMYLMLEEEENNGYLDSIPALGYIGRDEEHSPQEIEHPSAINMNQAYPPPDEILPNERYSVPDLIFRMLAYSDNRAFALLAEHLIMEKGTQEFEKIYKDLGLISLDQSETEFVSVRTYASLFRLLYNASYVNAEYSEKILGYMNESTFKNGLVAGLPEKIRVSHKFGERGVQGTTELQLHDCGIVYYPGNPYVLCVMTKGESISELALVIAHISREVYEEVDSRKK